MKEIQSPRFAEVFVPDGAPLADALARTTHLALGAHHDDLEIMAIDGVLSCYERKDRWFTGVVVTNGAGAPLSGPFASITAEQLIATRAAEQRSAAATGKYSAVIMLNHPSEEVKDPRGRGVVDEIRSIAEACAAKTVYTHNPFDKHDTHVAVCARVIEALSSLPQQARPEKLYGCEVWRDLDWLPDELKVVLDCSEHVALQEELIRVFESQIGGGKRYDLAAMGRRRANATYLDPRTVDQIERAAYAIDLTPTIRGSESLSGLSERVLNEFHEDVARRLASVSAEEAP